MITLSLPRDLRNDQETIHRLKHPNKSQFQYTDRGNSTQKYQNNHSLK